ncbi:CBS domain-containing protein [Geodermatophilus sp. YIM 151500]|uniref:CBS domain-containing protein n=1 Tax=Geodermatophilus sp. YIM 151500 TaxID=2984531 RepID=UPI0021E44968|nr:CBS domain-containing protein [Geodermatophilus sp. YIM 151500]MCV2487891.1 CBS domain-containing protein [Geodermatophilus sp. YIM 151500]
MTRAVVTVGPETSAKYAAEVMAEHGFAALPIVDDEDRLVGIVAEADVLRRRVPEDPRLHLRRHTGAGPVPPLRVGRLMTTDVRTVDAAADVADIARILVDGGLRSAPVLEHGRLVGIVSRRDLLTTLVRPDERLRDELLGLVEGYTGEPGAVDVSVSEGVATIRRLRGVADPSAEAEQRAFEELGRTVGGVVAVHVAADPGTAPTGTTPARTTTTSGGRR